jgi:hypothetical protein
MKKKRKRKETPEIESRDHVAKGRGHMPKRVRRNGRPHGGKRAGAGRPSIYSKQRSIHNSVLIPITLWEQTQVNGVSITGYVRLMWSIFQANDQLMEKLNDELKYYRGLV